MVHVLFKHAPFKTGMTSSSCKSHAEENLRSTEHHLKKILASLCDATFNSEKV